MDFCGIHLFLSKGLLWLYACGFVSYLFNCQVLKYLRNFNTKQIEELIYYVFRTIQKIIYANLFGNRLKKFR